MIKYRGLKNKLAFLLSLSLVMSPMTALGAEDTFDAADVQTVGEDVEQSGDETATEVTTETGTDGMEEVTDESAEISDGAETAEDDAELIEDSSELAEEEDAFTEEESEVTGSESFDIGFEDEEEINGMVGYSESEVSDGHEDEDEYGIVFDNLDEVPEVPENVIREEAETALGADGVTTADSEKYIPIGHMSSEEYTNYHTRARQQSIKAGADASGKRKYINETCWGFATMGAMEASYNMHHGISNAVSENKGLGPSSNSVDLSERDLVYFTYFNDNRKAADPLKTLEKDNNYLYIGSTDINTANKATITEAFALGGSPSFALETLAMGIGPVTEQQVPYSTEDEPDLNLKAVDSQYKFAKEYTLTDSKTIDMAQKSLVKSMILKYGGVSTSIFYSSGYPTEKVSGNSTKVKQKVGADGLNVYNYMNLEKVNSRGDISVYYHHPSTAQNHNILIVGWDDTIPAEKFVNEKHKDVSEIQNGGWLCKNSYGNEETAPGNTGKLWGYEYGYFWLSYDSTDQLLKNDGVRRGYTFDITTLEGESEGVTENKTYQYDGSAFSKEISLGSSYANVYTVKDVQEGATEYLRSVMVKLATPGSVYSVQLYENPELPDPTSGTPILEKPVYGKVDAAGYYSVDLGRGISLTPGTKVAVVVNLYKVNISDDTPGIYAGVSGKYTMSVATNSVVVSPTGASTVPAMYYCQNSTNYNHSLLFNTNTKTWEDMYKNDDSKNIHGNLRIKLKTVVKTTLEERIDPDYTVIDHFVKKEKDVGTKKQPLITLESHEDVPATTILYVGQTARIRVLGATNAQWTSKKTKIAVVESGEREGLITAVKRGVTKISTMVDGKEYAHRIMVKNPSFVVTRKKVSLTNTGELPINGLYQDVIYESAKPDVVSVNAITGDYETMKCGSALVKAMMGKTTLKCKIMVPKIELTTRSITLAPEYPQFQLKLKDKKINTKGAVYSTSDPMVADVDSVTGMVKAVGNGKCQVTMTVRGSSVKCKVEVTGF